MAPLARLLLRHRRLVVLVWLVALVAGVAASATVSDRVSASFALPGRPGYEANQAILARYGTGGPAAPFVPVVRLPAGVSVGAARPALAAAFTAAGRAAPGRVVSYASTGDRRFVSADGRVTYGLVYPPPTPGSMDAAEQPDRSRAIAAAMRAALPPGAAVTVTGLPALSEHDSESANHGVAELTLGGGVLALVVLAFVFGSLLALVPLLIAGVTIFTTLLAVVGLTTFTTVNVFVEYLAALIGLGVAIDYSLLLVTRWREEIHRGRDRHDAVVAAMASAGRAVAVSAVTVAAGLLSLVVLPVPSIRSVGYAGMLIPLLAAAATLTLLPVLLAAGGRRLDWPHRRTEASASRGWVAWTRGVLRAPRLAAAVAAGALAVLAVFALALHTGTAGSDALGGAGPARHGLATLRQAGVGSGVLTPIEVLVPAGTDPTAVAARLDTVPGVRAAVAPADPGWRRNGTALVAVLPAAESSTDTGRATVQRVRDGAPEGVRVGGIGARDIDVGRAVYGSFPLMVAVIAAATFLLLARAFRSIVLAAKAVLVDLLSLAAVTGAMVLVWQDGHGSRLLAGVPGAGALNAFVPLLIFAFLFGISMDYEVFLLSRIREEYDRSGDTRTAIVEGVGRTGRLVTSAALILFLAFGTLMTAPGLLTKVFASAMGGGILLDATVVRSLLVPAVLAVLGRRSWWLPRWARRRLPPAKPPADLPDTVTTGGRPA